MLHDARKLAACSSLAVPGTVDTRYCCRRLTVCSDTSHVAPPPIVDTSNADEQGKLPDLAGAFRLTITALLASANRAEVSSRTAGRHSPLHCTGLMPTPGSHVSSKQALLGWHTRPPVQLFGRKGSQVTI
jgi:hypothetical protein